MAMLILIQATFGRLTVAAHITGRKLETPVWYSLRTINIVVFWPVVNSRA